ncbi:MAG: LysR family transcriptional regulator [Prevotella sp.]|nr:LysR family transcriptional regulator [Prevotella sp.]
MKYAVEVAKLGSINKAAETLMIAPPNISRSIKELEADLGITISSDQPKELCSHRTARNFSTTQPIF